MVANVAVESGTKPRSTGIDKSHHNIKESTDKQTSNGYQRGELPNGVSLDGLTSSETNSITHLLLNYKDAFAENDMDLGCCDVIPHQITSRDGAPIRLPYRRVPPTQIPEMKQLLQEMLDKGIIQKSKVLSYQFARRMAPCAYASTIAN
ncbi:uncharacterized protein LOC117107206 [Anneissia japonica]|uniref:uncharacterized protein LOC117107206 n=1 Tax=Anneissia japonica TaxID=1529436 RepID=UPI001425B760|nr:uncharacterized protein LOC117107206 [Anneissia japonica]